VRWLTLYDVKSVTFFIHCGVYRMSVTFTKLFSSITESTVWCEKDRTRLLWITMLAMADRHGRVWGSIPGLATFLSPDRYSRTPDHDGRRIEPIDGGWRLLNHSKYRDLRDEESQREAKRIYMANRRKKEKQSLTINANHVDVVNKSVE
jgi:hypothetical protein